MKFSIESRNDFKKLPASAPSTILWSYDSEIMHIYLIPITSPEAVSITTGRFFIEPMARIAT